MQMIETELSEVFEIKVQTHTDDRGHFFESFNINSWLDYGEDPVIFKQVNHSLSKHNVIRGIHYQVVKPQAKLIRVLSGKILDVAVDLRRDSPTFGKYVVRELSAETNNSMWIPEQFGHGFQTLSPTAEIMYMATEVWIPRYDRCIRWDDRSLNIPWQLTEMPILSEKDLAGSTLIQADLF